MVSLFDIIATQQLGFSHVLTRVGDDTQFSPAVYDFQTTPTNIAGYAALTNIIILHLSHLTQHRVVVIDCLDRFPFDLVTRHPQFRARWEADGLLIHYTCRRFAQLYQLMAQWSHRQCVVIVNHFHELVDDYRLELRAGFVQEMLAYKLEKAHQAVANVAAGVPCDENMPVLPAGSDLVRELAVSKFDSHVLLLLTTMSQLCTSHTAKVCLMGCLNTRFRQLEPWPVPMTSSQAPRDPRDLSRAPSRMMLVPNEICNDYIAQRFVFYRDWLQKTPRFAEEGVYKSRISHTELALVYGLRVESKNTSKVVYFDIESEGACQFSVVPLRGSSLMEHEDITEEPEATEETEETEATEEQEATEETEVMEQSEADDPEADEPEMTIDARIEADTEEPSEVLHPLENPNDPAQDPSETESELTAIEDLESTMELSTTTSVSYDNGIVTIRLPPSLA